LRGDQDCRAAAAGRLARLPAARILRLLAERLALLHHGQAGVAGARRLADHGSAHRDHHDHRDGGGHDGHTPPAAGTVVRAGVTGVSSLTSLTQPPRTPRRTPAGLGSENPSDPRQRPPAAGTPPRRRASYFDATQLAAELEANPLLHAASKKTARQWTCSPRDGFRRSWTGMRQSARTLISSESSPHSSNSASGPAGRFEGLEPCGAARAAAPCPRT
jgi:hypothetical protein